MIKVKIYNQKAEEAGEMELSPKIFGVKANEALIHQVLVAQLAGRRQVLAHTKGRAEVRGGGRKPWKQKGTGRARQGSIRAPQWIGGGVTFGPLKTRNFSKKINRKMKQKALLMVLSDRLASGNLAILEKLEMPEAKTKIFNIMIGNLEKKAFGAPDAGEKKRSVLVVNYKKDDNVKHAGRNLAGAEIISLENINLADLLKYRNIVIVAEAVKKLEARLK